MEANQQKLLDKLKHFIDSGFAKIFFSHPVLPCNSRDLAPRIVIVEKGEPLLYLGIGGQNMDVAIPSESVVYGMIGSSTGISPRQHGQSKTFAICFFTDYIRLVSYEFSDNDSTKLMFHLHTMKSLPAQGKTILDALNQFSNLPDMTECSIFLIRALLQMVYTMILKSENDKNVGKSEWSWKQIEGYLEANLGEDLTRRKIAAVFLMNQSYLSTLCRKHTGRSFNEYVRHLRLSQAVLLLDLNLSLDEISDRCGFQYTSYFIRLFKAQFGVSPGKFRLHRSCRRGN